ncbi:MAG: putative lipid II flippase FtsW [Spirochaetaceae bacterium]|nr:MAG: putative lipid II flippase FtsW [Spirochaetaceae bacterium]
MLGIGLSVLFSASTYYGDRLFEDPFYFFKRQLLWVTLGVVAAAIAAHLPLSFLRQATPFLVVAALLLTILTFVPGIGQPIMGARRWLFLFGQSFEPSEVVKFSLVLYLAAIFSKKRDRINDPVNSLLPPLLVVSLFVTLIYLQNDFSTAFFILLIALAMFLIAQVRIIYFILLSLLFVPLGGMLLFTKAHRVRRLMAFLNPLADPSGSGYQVIAAQTAFVSGGFWGRGLGKGVKKLGGLPEAHSDFIYAVVGEEAGFLGAVLVLLLFLLLAWRGYMLALKGKDSFTRYLAFGITSTITLQALLNIAVATGLVPATGIPLPLFSAGGSSMLITLMMGGVLINLSRQPQEQSHRETRLSLDSGWRD